jgi:hypothetical protein
MFALLLVLSSIIQASWDPELLDLKNIATMNVLKNQDLNDLKTRVFQYLQNSWCSKEKANLLLELMVLTTPGVCVEIGAFTGSSTLPILAGLQYCGQGRAYVIDAWSCSEAVLGLPLLDENTRWWGTLDMVAIKAQFDAMINSWQLGAFCQVLQMASKEAVSLLPFMDFLHLDGNFSSEGALLDSKLYVPKVKSGGYILLSNVHIMIAKRPSKAKALTVLLDQCEVVCEIDDGQTLLFRKK